MDERRAGAGEHPGELGVEVEGHGRAFSVRPATLADAEGLRRMFSRASPETVRLRFHLPFPDVPGWMLSLMVDADHHGGESLVAVEGGEVVGHAMYVRLGSGAEAELAIVVEDGGQSRGAGKSLLSELSRRAGLRGVEAFTAEVRAENRPMLGLAVAFAGIRRATGGGVYRIRVSLGALDPAMHEAARPLRGAA